MGAAIDICLVEQVPEHRLDRRRARLLEIDVSDVLEFLHGKPPSGARNIAVPAEKRELS
jgi:hypothetical protein